MYKPRTTRPEAGNKYYITKDRGGWSPCVYGNPTDSTSNVLANCVGYAVGRFNEIGGYGSCKYLKSVNAENMIEAAKAQGLTVGDVPQVGACMVWQRGSTLGNGDGAGHVAIVEEVISPTKVKTSESGWLTSPPWYMKTRDKGSKGLWHDNDRYSKFRGFIYNPAVKDGQVALIDSANTFATTALKYHNRHISALGMESLSIANGHLLCSHVAKECNLGAIIAEYSSVSFAMSYYKSKTNLGTYHKGKRYGGTYTPKKGDIAFIQTKAKSEYSSDDVADFASIVTADCKGTSMAVVEVRDTLIQSANRSLDDASGFWSPNWSMISGQSVDSGGVSVGLYYAPLYSGEELNDTKDMAVRGVCYVTPQGERTVEPTSIPLAVINYTPALFNIFEAIRPLISPALSDQGAGMNSTVAMVPGSYEFSELSDKIQIIIQTALNNGYNEAVGCGIAGNVYRESTFRPDLYVMDHYGDGSNAGMGGGLCGWLNSRYGQNYTDMINWVDRNYGNAKNNFSGQVNYIFYSIAYDGSVWAWARIDEKLKALPNTRDGAYKAADIFCDLYENPANETYERNLRGGFAQGYWDKLKTKSTAQVAPSTSVPSVRGTGSASAVINFFISKGFTKAAGVAVAANIYRESSFKPSTVGDGGTSFGICQWHADRGARMKSFVGSDWQTDFTGQLEFLLEELKSSYSSVYNSLASCPNTCAGAEDRARVFCKKFEIPKYPDLRASERASTAREYWNGKGPMYS